MVTITDDAGVLGMPKFVRLKVDARTFGAALRHAEDYAAVTLVPREGGKHFVVCRDGKPIQRFLPPEPESIFRSIARRIRGLPVPPPKTRESVTDIHVLRGDESICPAQNLDFPLEDGDVVSLSEMLLC